MGRMCHGVRIIDSLLEVESLLDTYLPESLLGICTCVYIKLDEVGVAILGPRSSP